MLKLLSTASKLPSSLRDDRAVPAMTPVEKELYEFAVRQVRATGLRVRSFGQRSRIARLLFGGPRDLTPMDVHRRPEPVRPRPKRLPLRRVGGSR